MRSSRELVVRYVAFAGMATVLNIGAQDVVVRVYSGIFQFWLSIAVGTGVGLIVKYWLDKNFIFEFHSKKSARNRHSFLLYALTGVVTTAIFWGLEFGFEYFFESRPMRYIGGAIGLSIGYLLKYRLDKRYVFSCP